MSEHCCASGYKHIAVLACLTTYIVRQGDTVDSEHLSELTEEEYEVNFVKPHLKGFLKLDAKYLIPFFTRKFTQKVSICYTS